MAGTGHAENRFAEGPCYVIREELRGGLQIRRSPVSTVSRRAQISLAQMQAIADSGFLVAFADRRDYHHRWVRGVAEGVTEPLLTCEAVLTEAAFHLGSNALVLAMVQDRLVRSAFVLRDHIARFRN
jgi:hypothetical protein